MATRTKETPQYSANFGLNRSRTEPRDILPDRSKHEVSSIKTGMIIGGLSVILGGTMMVIDRITAGTPPIYSSNGDAGQAPYGDSGKSGDKVVLGAAATMVLQSAKDTYDANNPSPTPTGTSRPTATNSPDPASNLDFCTGTPELGKLCKVPYPPPATTTPYPSCLNMDQLSPGDWCIWPTANPDADPTEFGIVLPAQTSAPVPSEIPTNSGH